MELAADVGGGETLQESENLVPGTDEVRPEEQERAAEELKEIKYNGKNYKIPGRLKGALPMQADDTRARRRMSPNSFDQAAATNRAAEIPLPRPCRLARQLPQPDLPRPCMDHISL